MSENYTDFQNGMIMSLVSGAFKGVDSASNIIFSSKVPTNLNNIKTFIGSRNPNSQIIKTQEKITLIGTNGSYSVDCSPVIYARVDLTKYDRAFIKTSRTNSNGRMYFFATKSELADLGSTEWESIPGVVSYISDSSSINYYSINVESLSGFYNLGFANAAKRNETYVHEIRLL